MNIKTFKYTLAALLAQTICFTVVLSHLHAKDALSLYSQTAGASRSVASTSDITAKAMGDLHHHVDKAGLKNITADSGQTTAARTRELSPLNAEVDEDISLRDRFYNFLLRFRVVSSLIYEYA